MEIKLNAILDFQKFQNNKRLAKIITNAEQSFNSTLNDDDLSYVSAAGDLYNLPKIGKDTDDT